MNMIKTSEIELKPCPFCGGRAVFQDNNSCCSYVYCKKCGATGETVNVSKKFSSDEKAAEKWNRRINNDI